MGLLPIKTIEEYMLYCEFGLPCLMFKLPVYGIIGHPNTYAQYVYNIFTF